MKKKLSRRDFLKFSAAALGGLAFAPAFPPLDGFDDSTLVRVATDSVSVHSLPDDTGRIVSQLYRDELVRVYELVKADRPAHNPYWYRVWGGYAHRTRLQPVKVLYNQPLDFIPEGERRLAEVTVPYTQPWRFTKAYGWEAFNPPLYFGSVHWLDRLEAGPDGQPWYRIFDELDSNVGYYARARDFRPIPPAELAPISPDVPKEQKRIEVNLSAQSLVAFEYDRPVFQTQISSGIPAADFNTPKGEFYIEEKLPAKHMGYSYFGLSKGGSVNLFADADNYVLPGVPWTCFFTPAGHAFHGTYWHDNFGAPMSHGCVNMRSEDARWLFCWVRPAHRIEDLSTKHAFGGERGTAVSIHY